MAKAPIICTTPYMIGTHMDVYQFSSSATCISHLPCPAHLLGVTDLNVSLTAPYDAYYLRPIRARR